jgi:hypothetical protein
VVCFGIVIVSVCCCCVLQPNSELETFVRVGTHVFKNSQFILLRTNAEELACHGRIDRVRKSEC